MVKVKFCGITKEAEIKALNILKPDFVGFVFAKSKRQISLDIAKHLRDALDCRIQSVGVFVDEKIEVIQKAVGQNIINAIQLHGSESVEYLQALRAITNAPIIKAVSLEQLSAFKVLEYDKFADFLLFDSKVAGSGKTFNWNLLDNLNLTKPYFLAGGLNAANLKDALRWNPYGVDLSSGIECDGVKSFAKMQEILEIVRIK